MYAIEVKNVSKRYGAVQALDGVSFSVNKGEGRQDDVVPHPLYAAAA